MTSNPFDLEAFDAPTTSVAHQPAPGGYFDGLNERQREAVAAGDGPMLVLAGAGTGKTRVLTTRLAHLLASGRAWPGQILAVTFTNRAAREMRERVEALIGGGAAGLWLGTFHAIGARIVRRNAELVGLKPSFTILDQDDQSRLCKQVLRDANVDEQKWPARRFVALLDRWKSRGLVPERLPAAEIDDFANGRGADLYGRYQARLKQLNAADFGDLLLHCLTVFAGHADVLADYQRRFKYILVDEYQDTNVAQYLWLRLLAQGHRNLCCVGDDDQSIYSWRGAEVGNILRFEKDFPGAKVVRLERNYRSTGHILGAAAALISHNEGRLGKALFTGEGNGGIPVRVTALWDGPREAALVAGEIAALQANGARLSHTAVLVRAGFQTREFEERFLAAGIPYRVIGGVRFYERQEVRDVIAYLRVIAQADDDLAFERILNVPKRGLGEGTLGTLRRLAAARGVSLHTVAANVAEGDGLRPQARKSLALLMAGFERWRAAAGGLPLPELVERVIEESGYRAMWEADKSADAQGRLDNLGELTQSVAAFMTLDELLEYVGLVLDNAVTDRADMVNLMTLHGAKGLEFDTVFLPGWEEGLLPHERALTEGGLASLEEERRLAHVGITRARHRVYISYAANRRVYNRWNSAIPSRFVDELPAEHVEMVSETGLYGHEMMGNTGLESRALGGDGAWPRPELGRRSNPYQRYAEATGSPAGAATACEPRVGAEFNVGDRVFHQKFGYGRVRLVEGQKLEIAFDKTGVKKVMSGFVAAA